MVRQDPVIAIEVAGDVPAMQQLPAQHEAKRDAQHTEPAQIRPAVKLFKPSEAAL